MIYFSKLTVPTFILKKKTQSTRTCRIAELKFHDLLELWTILLVLRGSWHYSTKVGRKSVEVFLLTAVVVFMPTLSLQFKNTYWNSSNLRERLDSFFAIVSQWRRTGIFKGHVKYIQIRYMILNWFLLQKKRVLYPALGTTGKMEYELNISGWLFIVLDVIIVLWFYRRLSLLVLKYLRVKNHSICRFPSDGSANKQIKHMWENVIVEYRQRIYRCSLYCGFSVCLKLPFKKFEEKIN